MPSQCLINAVATASKLIADHLCLVAPHTFSRILRIYNTMVNLVAICGTHTHPLMTGEHFWIMRAIISCGDTDYPSSTMMFLMEKNRVLMLMYDCTRRPENQSTLVTRSVWLLHWISFSISTCIWRSDTCWTRVCILSRNFWCLSRTELVEEVFYSDKWMIRATFMSLFQWSGRIPKKSWITCTRDYKSYSTDMSPTMPEQCLTKDTRAQGKLTTTNMLR